MNVVTSLKNEFSEGDYSGEDYLDYYYDDIVFSDLFPYDEIRELNYDRLFKSLAQNLT